jgi:AcrR family transcriptional regulator
MVRKFEDREKEMIHSKLLSQGKQMFATLGLKKTSISDLTKAAGIAQGSFYMFYRSKEELYFEILEQEEESIRNQLVEQHFSSGTMTRESFRQFLRHSLDIMADNPLIQQLYDSEQLEMVMRKLPEEKMLENFQEDAHFIVPFILQAQEQGRMIQRDPDTIVSLIRSLVLLSLQKQQIGEDRYGDTMDLLVELIANGLMLD